MAGDHAGWQQCAINLRAFLRNLRMDGNANENFRSCANEAAAKRREKERQSRFVKRIRDARWTMEQSILGYCKTNLPVPRQSLPAISPLVIGSLCRRRSR